MKVHSPAMAISESKWIGENRRLETTKKQTWQRIFAIGVLLLLCFVPAVATAEVGQGNNAVGVNAHVATPAFVDAIDDLGAGWIRLDGNWWTLEPSSGDYHWGPLDDAVSEANDAGLNILITFAYTPTWVPASGDGNHITDVPNSSVEWENFMEDAVARYRSMGVRHFGIWNEPNLENFFNGTAHDYVNTILLPGASAVRDVCSDCYVVGPHLSSSDRQADEYLRTILDEAGGDIFDIIAHHTYYGFLETGQNPWDRRYVNTLDEFCDVPFMECHDPIRYVLDEYGYDGEVWITETGVRALPENSDDEERQATFITRALEEQLERDWYTNTFFYEIHDCGPDQPECSIDGYGLMRAVSGQHGSRTFPDDFYLKPSFHALSQFINDHPEFSTEPEPVDPDEVTALRSDDIDLDADLSAFGDAERIALDSDDWQGLNGASFDGTTVEAALRWSPDTLYLGVEVDQAEHHNNHDAEQLWQGDSLQIAFDTGSVGGFGFDSVNHHEMGFALSGSDTVAHRFHGPTLATDGWEVRVERVGSTTHYQVQLEPEALSLASFQAEQTMGFTFLINVADASGRLGWLEFTPGLGDAKNPEYFAQMKLADDYDATASEPDPDPDPEPDPDDSGDDEEQNQNESDDEVSGDDGTQDEDSADASQEDTDESGGPSDDPDSQDDSQEPSAQQDTDSEADLSGDPVDSESSCSSSSATPTGDGVLIWMALLLVAALRLKPTPRLSDQP